MAELIRIAEDFTKMGTEESYRQRRAQIFANLDPLKEYAVMGKIFCSNCRAEISLDMPERNFFTKCKCDCIQKREEAEARKKARIETAKKYRWQNDQAIPVDDKSASFYGIFDKTSSDEYINACSRCEKFCDVFQTLRDSGRGIWLYGDVDSGKTYLAVAMLKKLENSGVICLFTTVETILGELKSTYKSNSAVTEQAVIAKYSDVECLFLNDFGGIKETGKAYDWAASKFGEIIKRRYDKKRPMVITSRASIRDFAVGNKLPRETVEKLASRQVLIKLTGSRRKAVQAAIEF